MVIIRHFGKVSDTTATQASSTQNFSMRSIAGYSALLAFATSTLAGRATVVNNCGFDVSYKVVGPGTSGNIKPLPLPKSGYSQSFAQSISVKLYKSSDLNSGKSIDSVPVSQFEFSADTGKVYYDISNINGNPFMAEGTRHKPTTLQPPGFENSCVEVDCPAGAATCTAAYNQPDDVRTKVCPDTDDLTFTLCSGNAGSSNSGGSGAGSNSNVAVMTAAQNQNQAAETVATPSAAKTTNRRGGHKRGGHSGYAI